MKRRHWFGLLLPVVLMLSTPAPWVIGAAPSSKEEKTTLTIKGMTCGGCVATVKLKLKKTKGVLVYKVSLEKGEADITYEPALTCPEEIADAVSETGFTTSVKTRAGSDGRKGGGVEPAARPTTSSGPSAHYDPRMGSVCEMTCAARIPYKEADLVPQPGAKFGDLTRCPVSGVVFKVGKQSPHVSHAGKQYFVCCRTCAAKFQANPEHFVG